VVEDFDGVDMAIAGLIEYARRFGNGAALKRLVYLTDHYGIPVPDHGTVETEFTEGSSPLDLHLVSQE
jgi:predicted transcriptional regulator of viral defense system